MKTKQTLIIAILAIAAIAGVMSLNLQMTAAVQPTTTVIDFSAETANDQIIMKKDQTLVIPFDIIAYKEKSLNVKVGVVEVGEEPQFYARGEEKLPSGIVAAVSKRVVQLPSETDSGSAIRDTELVTVTTKPDAKAGTYTLGLILYAENSDGSGTYSIKYFRIDVQE